MTPGILWRRQNEAEAHLDYAFEHCHARAAKNKAAIARFLIPVRMLLGALPAMGLLEAFGLTVYAPFVEVLPCHPPCILEAFGLTVYVLFVDVPPSHGQVLGLGYLTPSPLWAEVRGPCCLLCW